MQIHTVQKGDTLWKIAKMYGVDFEELKAANPQLSNPDLIMPGMKINIPSSNNERPYYVVKQGDTMWKIARMYGIPLQQLIAENPQIPDPNHLTIGMKVYLPTSLFHRHVVKAGETLWTIAQKYRVDFQALKAANPQLTNPDLIMPGDIVWVPKHTATPNLSYMPMPDLDLPEIDPGWRLESPEITTPPNNHNYPAPPANGHPGYPPNGHQMHPHHGYPYYAYPVIPIHPWHGDCCPYCQKPLT